IRGNGALCGRGGDFLSSRDGFGGWRERGTHNNDRHRLEAARAMIETAETNNLAAGADALGENVAFLEPLLGDLSETCGGECVGEDPAALITVDLLILAWRLAVGTQPRRLERGWGFFGANGGSLHLGGGSRLRLGRCCCRRALHGRLGKRRGRRSIRRRGSS